MTDGLEPRLKSACESALWRQAVVVLIGVGFMDPRRLVRTLTVSSAFGHLAGVVLILARRSRRPTAGDLYFVRRGIWWTLLGAGTLILPLATPLLWDLAGVRHELGRWWLGERIGWK